MPWPDWCEALVQAVTAEIVGAILDVAIARCRSHAFAVRRDHDKTAKFMRKLERRVRDAQSEAARDFHEADVDFWRPKLDRCAEQKRRYWATYRQDREWQNWRYGLPHGSRYAQLPWQARHPGERPPPLPPAPSLL